MWAIESRIIKGVYLCRGGKYFTQSIDGAITFPSENEAVAAIGDQQHVLRAIEVEAASTNNQQENQDEQKL